MKKNTSFRKSGFTFPEIIISMGIFILLISIIMVSLFRAQSSSVQAVNIDVLISDIKSQQVKAMTGEGENENSLDFGVYLENDKYTLFNGSSYNPNSDSNFKVSLDSSLSIINNTLQDSVIIFNKGSGEVSSAIAGQNSFSIKSSTSGDTKNITINKLGVIDVE